MKHFLLGGIILLIAATACRFTGPDELPPSTPLPQSTPTEQASQAINSETVCRQLRPNDTNSAITEWNEPHIVCAPAEANQHKKLFVFLPGTGATPDYYTYLMKAAAESGLHAIALRYPNDRSVNLQICPRDFDNDCHEKNRHETLTGIDTSKHVTVDEDNSITGRLLSALTSLAVDMPEEGWDQYLENEAVRWESIVVAGHSQGGGHAVYLAYHHHVERVISFAWVDVRKGDLADWLTEKVSQTPPDAYYLFWHEDDDLIAKFQPALMEALGIDGFGAPAVVDENSAPYQGSHALIATYPAPPEQLAHNTHVADMALVFDENGTPIYQPVWQYLLTLDNQMATTTVLLPTVQNLNAVKIGNSPLGYYDPEFYSDLNLITYADANMDAWLGSLDPQTGGFVSLSGRDLLIDEDLTPLRISFNAPEFGVDSEGWALYYTKEVNGVSQVFRATVNGTMVVTEALTDDSFTRLSTLATKNPQLESTRLLYAHGGFSSDEGHVAWLDEDNPQYSETLVDTIDRGARWIDGTASFTYIRDGQAVIHDTETNTTHPVTDTTGEKTYAYGWLAPETGDLIVLTIVDDSRIEVYADNDTAAWNLTAVLEIPAASDYSIIGSPEPFTAGGKSYISLVVKADKGYAPAEVWIWSIDEADPFLQCNDGQGSVIRTDPETYIGSQEVFVFYNLIHPDTNPQIFELYRCDTGLMP
jgi:pimeloyl-ACP methyl ester carboxylesterase